MRPVTGCRSSSRSPRFSRGPLWAKTPHVMRAATTTASSRTTGPGTLSSHRPLVKARTCGGRVPARHTEHAVAVGAMTRVRVPEHPRRARGRGSAAGRREPLREVGQAARVAVVDAAVRRLEELAGDVGDADLGE